MSRLELIQVAVLAVILVVILQIEAFSAPEAAEPTLDLVEVSLEILEKEVENEPDFEEAPTEEGEISTEPATPTLSEPSLPEIAIELPPDPEPISFSSINTEAREALVNILCLTTKGSGIGSITGSGVVIDSQGVILTNAHIAQYYLLLGYPNENAIECTVRTGSPAVNTYKAELLYISPDWVEENTDVLTTENPLGTGEWDYGLLRITEKTDDSPLPQSFSYVPISVDPEEILEESPVLLASYPAGFSGGSDILKNLYAVTTIAEVGKLYTFKDFTVDLFSIGGSVVAQRGSSGGAVINKNSELIGLIVTSTDGSTTDERDLRAISAEYINRSFAVQSGKTLELYLSEEDIPLQALLFQEAVAPTLSQILINAITQ